MSAAEKDPSLSQRIVALRVLKGGVLAGAPRPPAGFVDRVAALAAGLSPAPIVDVFEMRRFLRRMLVAAAVLAAIGLAYFAFEVAPVLFDEPVMADPLLRK